MKMECLRSIGTRARGGWLTALLALLGVLASWGAGAARADDAEAREPRMYLSWNAPYGMPRASDHLTTACGDTTRADTLYLSFTPGTRRPAIGAMEAIVYFHALAGDSLRDFWFFKRGQADQFNMTIQFDPTSEILSGALPWKSGRGQVAYDHDSGRGRLDLAFTATSNLNRGMDPDRVYWVARVIIRQRRCRLPGCLDPVCVELASLRLKPLFGPDIEITHGDDRFATWNSTTQSCAPVWRTRVEAWRPPVETGKTPATWEYRPKPASFEIVPVPVDTTAADTTR